MLMQSCDTVTEFSGWLLSRSDGLSILDSSRDVNRLDVGLDFCTQTRDRKIGYVLILSVRSYRFKLADDKCYLTVMTGVTRVESMIHR